MSKKQVIQDLLNKIEEQKNDIERIANEMKIAVDCLRELSEKGFDETSKLKIDNALFQIYALIRQEKERCEKLEKDSNTQTPNIETINSMKEIENGETQSFNSISELIQELKN